VIGPGAPRFLCCPRGRDLAARVGQDCARCQRRRVRPTRRTRRSDQLGKCQSSRKLRHLLFTSTSSTPRGLRARRASQAAWNRRNVPRTTRTYEARRMPKFILWATSTPHLKVDRWTSRSWRRQDRPPDDVEGLEEARGTVFQKTAGRRDHRRRCRISRGRRQESRARHRHEH